MISGDSVGRRGPTTCSRSAPPSTAPATSRSCATATSSSDPHGLQPRTSQAHHPRHRMGRVDTVPLFDARARVLADLQARNHATAHAVSILEDAVSAREWWADQWPEGQVYVAGLVAQDVQDGLFETAGRWPLCLDLPRAGALALHPARPRRPRPGLGLRGLRRRGRPAGRLGRLGQPGPTQWERGSEATRSLRAKPARPAIGRSWPWRLRRASAASESACERQRRRNGSAGAKRPGLCGRSPRAPRSALMAVATAPSERSGEAPASASERRHGLGPKLAGVKSRRSSRG